jgi:hypothetical protein
MKRLGKLGVQVHAQPMPVGRPGKRSRSRINEAGPPPVPNKPNPNIEHWEDLVGE